MFAFAGGQSEARIEVARMRANSPSSRTERETSNLWCVSAGAGLPSQQADQIFHAFFTTKPHGIGMGLAICRSIVESHSGRLWAADNSPRGARFHLILPTRSMNA